MKDAVCVLGQAGLIVAVMVSVEGCKKEKRKPATQTINLRVVMFVETGANLNSPPLETGGCKLTRSQVLTLVNDLVAFGSNAAPGIKFVWSGNPVKLESDCMKLLGFPFPPCTSQCGELGACPRELNAPWFLQNVVNHGPGGSAGLPEGDNYDHNDCTINIYFVGNMLSSTNQVIDGTTFRVPPGSSPTDFVLINDVALTDPAAPPNLTWLRNRKTLIHEVVCHWLPNGDNHPVVSPGECPDNICVDGDAVAACSATYGGIRPGTVLPNVQAATNALRHGCE